MSTYIAKAFNPVSKQIEDATYIDDYYGNHRYGIRFDDGLVHPQAQCGLDAAATALEAQDKELAAYRLAEGELRELLCLFVKQYCDPIPEWRPLEDLRGMISQFDNATTVVREIKARAETAERRVAELEEERDKTANDCEILCNSYADNCQRLHDRMEAAERERDEAREALKKFVKVATSYPITTQQMGISASDRTVARAITGGKP